MTRDRARQRAVATAVAVAVAAGAAATAGYAQLGDVGEQTQVDTDYTPVAKASERWQWFAGAKFSSGGPRPENVPEGSVTPFEADFFDLDFRAREEFGETDVGLAGGAECPERLPAEASAAEARDQLAGCDRVPVIYRYSVNDVGEDVWEEVYRGEGRGYVGAVAWIDRERALAVGGTGRYPRRELRRADGESDAAYMARNDAGVEENAAGMARAWLYEGGVWRELTDAELPAGMRGMSALDFSPRKADCGEDTKSECGFAGGLRQLWRYRDGRFDKGYIGGRPGDSPPPSATTDLDRPELLRFRVREIEFDPKTGGAAPLIGAYGVTSGCCDPDALKNVPWVLIYTGERWNLRQSGGEAASVFYNESKRDLATGRPGDSAYETGRSQYESVGRTPLQNNLNFVFGFTGQKPPNPLAPHCGSLAPVFGPADERPLCPLGAQSPAGAATEPAGDAAQQTSAELTEAYRDATHAADEAAGPYGLPRRQVPDSYYAVSVTGGGGTGSLNPGVFQIAATPGGPVPDPGGPGAGATTEPAAQILQGTATAERGIEGSLPNVNNLAFTPGAPAIDQAKLLTTLRIHSLGGGRVSGSPGLEAVGVLGSTGQGVAFGPKERNPDRGYELHHCKAVTPPSECDPDVDRGVRAQGSLQLFKLPAYALNSLELTDEFRNEGWAVGDHGAILKLGAETAAGAAAREPQPPQLGSREPATLPDSSAYDAFRPFGAAEPGLVPPLAGRPRVQLEEPRFVAGGSPNSLLAGSPDGTASQSEEVEQIVMSRDGSEGWAIGSALALHHFDGSRWRRCDTDGVAGLVEPDPACRDLAPLRRANVKLYAAARIPLEHDSDPENDDEFELIAVGGAYQTRAGEPERPVVLRYSRGEWTVDEDQMRQIAAGLGSAVFDVAFTSPDDGWAIAGQPGFWPTAILHFDGTSWRRCGSGAKACDDLDGRLPASANHIERVQSSLRLTTVGDRTYLYGTRRVAKSELAGASAQLFPMIVYHDRGEPCEAGGDAGCWRASGDGYDPSFGQDPPPAEEQGRVFSVSVAEGDGGALDGWAVGQLGGTDGRTAHTTVMRFVDGRWQRWTLDDASADYLREPSRVLLKLLASPGAPGRWSAFLFPAGHPSLGFNRDRERWEALPAPFWTKPYEVLPPRARGRGAVRAVAPDGRGGFWAAVRQGAVCSASDCQTNLYFYDFTDRPPRAVFEDVAHPVTDRQITAMTAGGDGSLWVATASSALYRYDRLVGWDRVVVPGWDPPRATVASAVTAVAVGPDGRGIAVGAGGRIAEVGPNGARLDAAAGTVCDLAAPVAPCGTGRTLSAVAIAADGAALTAANAGTLLWRPGGGEFRRIEGPRIPPATVVTGVSLPEADHAYLATADGEVIAGQGDGAGNWRWRVESLSESRTPLSLDAQGGPIRINAIAIEPSGHGYAVGDRGLVLEREVDGGWRRLATGYLDNFHSLALPPGDGKGVLVGGENGLVLTLVGDRFEVAHHSDPLDPVNGAVIGTTSVLGVALAPGAAPGQLEAWAALQTPGDFRSSQPVQALLHYASDPEDPLLAPERRATALPDSPAARPGELAFAAFGKQECRFVPLTQACPEAPGANLAHDVIARAVNEQIARRADRPGGPAFALFTGDANDAAGGAPTPAGVDQTHTPADRNLKHRRWIELTADPLAEELPLFGAIGGQDLSHVASCDRRNCVGTRGAGTFELGVQAGAGANVQWRETMGRAPAPWEAAGGRETERLGFERVGDGALSVRAPETAVPAVPVRDPGGTERARVREQTLGGGASTHYAVDVTDRADGRKVARLVFVDTSLGSLAAGDPVQQPLEGAGGQAGWLEQMLCVKGAPNATRVCDREPSQQAIVVSNTPTYTYARIPATETQTDASAFEAILLRHKANVVVSGRLGWNGRYWATAPGVHEPCPDAAYQPDEAVPEPGTRACGRSTGDLPVDPQGGGDQAGGELAATLGGLDAPALPAQAEPVTDAAGVASGLAGVLPFVVSSAAGGRFNETATSTAARDGFWSGYSVIRLDASGDPTKTIVEQRPVLDWVAIRAQERTLRPGQKMTLRGFGREPIGIDQPLRYVEIDSPAITHRYDLLLADPGKPYLPLEDANGDYVPLPAQVATVDRQTGALKTGKGRGERTYAIAILSVGDEAATYPLVFEPRRSFAPQRAKVTLPALPRAARAPVAQQPLRLTDAAPPPPPAPPATPATPISSTSLQAPQPPQFPSLPTVNPAGPPPAPSLNAPPPPPAPPAPPPAPPQQQPQPLALGAKVQAVAIVPSVNPPAPPPVNPAPPGGAAARKEAKQRQAATAKSEEGSSDGAGAGEGIDVGQGGRESSPDGSAMTRLEHPFTRVARPEQASAWARTALYGGGLGLGAAALALGFLTLRPRPRPRRREPPLPAPAWARNRPPR